MRVLIVGGGIGGLALAQGLRGTGVQFDVFERDRAPTARLQGYRISIRDFGAQALSQVLSPELFSRFQSTCGVARMGISMVTHQLSPLVFFDTPAPDPERAGPGHYSVSRMNLRSVLLSGLEDRVHFGKKFVRFVQEDGGEHPQVRAFFDDGSSEVGDLLVGADGVNSVVRDGLLLEGSNVVQTGVIGIAGKVFPGSGGFAPGVVPPGLEEGPFLVLAPGGRCLFTALQEFGSNDPAGDRDYLMWGLNVKRSLLGDTLSNDAEGLQQKAQELVADFHPSLQKMIAAADPSSVVLLDIRTSERPRHWPAVAGRVVTLMGDAAHSMTPAAGVGGNTALQDAALLSAELGKVQSRSQTVVQALELYEKGMMDYGYRAVDGSLRNLRMIMTEGTVQRTLLLSLLRGLGIIMSARRCLRRLLGW